MTFTVHTLVKNEDCWIWFALHSILPFADEIIIYDTGSTDKTVEVIQSINSPKIKLEKKGNASKKELISLRQEQLQRTKTDWFLVLDGDEIWSAKELEKLLSAAKNAPKNIIALFSRAKNCIGDVYHYLPENAGNYEIAGVKGNLNIRLIRKNADLKLTGEYPLESYTDSNGPIEKQGKNLKFVDCWYLHTTFLKRSTTVKHKTSGSFGKDKFWERGIILSKNDLPEVLFLERPETVPNPLKKRSLFYEGIASISSPLLNIKRNLK